MLPRWLSNAVIGVVTAVWVANFVAPMVVEGYESDPQLNLVFMTIVGGALALRSKKDDDRPGKGADNDSSGDAS